MYLRRKLKYNFAQSYYALEYLNKNKFSNIDYLSDYINDSYLDVKEDIEKKNVVLYNPKKGLEFTEYLMSIDKSITWIPLMNLTNQQVKDLTNTSKVYIDFGNHPGKDRFHREAAVSGCCIITGKKGAAAFFKDVPIPEKYKFEDKKENGYSIINKIKECFDNYEECYKDFEFYREMIKNEHKLFDDDVKRLF